MMANRCKVRAHAAEGGPDDEGEYWRPSVSLAVAGGAWAQDPHPTFTVGTATASRGQTAYGVIKVPPGADAAADISVAVVHGAHPGPVLAIVAGSHGTEYTSIIAVEKLIGAVEAGRAVRDADSRAAREPDVVPEDRAAHQPRRRAQHERRVSRQDERHVHRARVRTQSRRTSSSSAITSSICTAATSTRICAPTATGRRPGTPRRTRRPKSWCWRSASTRSSSRPIGRRIRRRRASSTTPRRRAGRRASRPRRGIRGRCETDDLNLLVHGVAERDAAAEDAAGRGDAGRQSGVDRESGIAGGAAARHFLSDRRRAAATSRRG